MTTDTGAPWAMQLAARVEKVDPPSTADLCAAAVLAVIAVLDDRRAGPGGPWVEALEAWQGGGRIRKLVRRGRASAWERAQVPGGHTATVGRAEVRAYVPSPMDQVPDAVAKLQIRSTDLDDPPQIDAVPPSASGMLVAVTPSVPMSWGKQAAQCAHGGQLLWRKSSIERRAEWDAAGRPVTVIHPDPTLWERLVSSWPVEVHDGGFTEIPAGTLTVVASWTG